jgi:phage terminase large subunit GpA-like protein
MERKQFFQNLLVGVLGETWIETGEAPDWQRLYERREDWPVGNVPSGGLVLTAGADARESRYCRPAFFPGRFGRDPRP